MVIVVLGIAVAFIVVGIAAFAFSASRNLRVPVHSGPAVRSVGEPSRAAVARAEVVASSVPPPAVPPPALVPPSSPLFDAELEPAAAPAEIRWSKQFDARSGVLDDTARLRLIGDLGVIAKEWCVPLLSRAYEEERRPANRQAALISLAACRSRTAIATYRLAMISGDAEEKAIAADALADLEPPLRTKPRTAVEGR